MSTNNKEKKVLIFTAWQDYNCFLCDNKIPKGHQYWQHYYNGFPTNKEHTNCELHSHITAQ